ncbi:SAP30-binding protein isoform X4 [Elephas maximus indicus]|uniref:SAP30-binding protein isoform X4 n=1 Tax=Elephas maximus indicus TaxID=99487 RepID=UPI002116B117|nr:SAP30-binding protein isoform X4 [Elephas maximus indicus]
MKSRSRQNPLADVQITYKLCACVSLPLCGSPVVGPCDKQQNRQQRLSLPLAPQHLLGASGHTRARGTALRMAQSRQKEPASDAGGSSSPDVSPAHLLLQDKIQKLYERKIKEGMDMNYIIQRKKEFRNPSIYEKLIQFCAIDELGTNYPKDMFDPHGWSEDSYYEALAKAQKIEMDKLEKAKKERTKAYCRDVSAAPGDRSCPSPVRAGTTSSWIEFVTGTKKGTTTNATATTTTTASTAVADAQKRKSKWDSAIPVTTIAQPTILTTTATLPAVVTVTTSASGSKTTVISAVGTIVKKAKQ